MAPKKTKKGKKGTVAAAASSSNGGAASGNGSSPRVSTTSSPESNKDTPLVVEQEPEAVVVDPAVKAESIKEQGNAAFRAGKYAEATDLYTQAIELQPLEPNYLTNRAASLMALKRFRSALADCQTAVSLQSASPSPKILLRLARCQLALGLFGPSLSTVRNVISLEPGNTAAIALQNQATSLESHISRFNQAKSKNEWAMARIALENAFTQCEGGAPIEWRCWKVEMDLGRKKWDDALEAASDALRLEPNSPDVQALRGLVLFLTNRLPQATQHLVSALRYDPEHSRARLLLRRVREFERIKEEGNTAFKLGKLADAITKYGDALDVVGQREEEGGGGMVRAILLSNRATALFKLDKFQEALNDSNESLDLLPTSFKALRTRARIYQALEDYEASVTDFKASIEQCNIEGSHQDERSLASELKKAEVLLKRSKTKDYYKILNLPKTCSEIDIKRAYRKESLIHHPDKGGNEEQFKLVVEANAVLSDPQRRARYDSGVDEDGQTDSSGMGGMGGMGGVDISQLFAQMNGGFGGGGPFGGGGFHSHGGGHSHGFGF